MRIVVGLSGGIDSAVAAWLLRRDGHEAVGVHLTLTGIDEDALRATRRAAEALGIPLLERDGSERFRETVVLPALEAYAAGLTPNPCVVCNRQVKLEELLRAADDIGTGSVATGHYARVVRQAGRVRLLAALHRNKDQSYFLHRLTPDQLGRLVLPLGELSKDDVRALAREAGLPAVERPESQELCFVPPGSGVADLVERELPGRIRPGPVVGPGGERLGNHGGIHRFTVGQRRGLGIAAGEPVYVTALDPRTAAVTVGPARALERDRILVTDPSWLAGEPPPFPLRCTVRIRARHAGERCVVSPGPGETLEVRFVAPVRAPAPGQAAVFSDGDEVLGGGWIAPPPP